MDYFKALYPVDGQIPDKKGISDIVKEMGRGLGKITEIDYTFKNGDALCTAAYLFNGGERGALHSAENTPCQLVSRKICQNLA